jgi:hypothetical protein
MTVRDKEVAHRINLIRAEYREMPGLSLTKAQMQRLWGLDPGTCDVLLLNLERTSFLRKTQRGNYIRADRYH